jgi:hypothetical protein
MFRLTAATAFYATSERFGSACRRLNKSITPAHVDVSAPQGGLLSTAARRYCRGLKVTSRKPLRAAFRSSRISWHIGIAVSKFGIA